MIRTGKERMSDDTQIRPMSETDVEPGIELVMKVFDEFVAPDFRPEAEAFRLAIPPDLVQNASGESHEK